MSIDCTRNHWWVINGAQSDARFCPYCGENIERFRKINYGDDDYQDEEERQSIASARRRNLGEKTEPKVSSI